MRRTCSVTNCDRDAPYASGLCPTHEYRRKAGRPLDAPIGQLKKDRIPCSIEGCGKKAVAKGLCNTHWCRANRGYDMDPPIKPWNRGGTICDVPDCGKRAVSNGLCNSHAYQRDTGSEVGPRRNLRGASVEERLEFYSAPPNKNGCRLWLGGINRSGYPTMAPMAGYSMMAHRVAYRVATGENPESHEVIHHICGIKHCVEPAHLQKISPHENTAEMLERTAYVRRIAELEAEIERLKHID